MGGQVGAVWRVVIERSARRAWAPAQGGEGDGSPACLGVGAESGAGPDRRRALTTSYAVAGGLKGRQVADAKPERRRLRNARQLRWGFWRVPGNRASEPKRLARGDAAEAVVSSRIYDETPETPQTPFSA
jgi:hypothetical protein